MDRYQSLSSTYVISKFMTLNYDQGGIATRQPNIHPLLIVERADTPN